MEPGTAVTSRGRDGQHPCRHAVNDIHSCPEWASPQPAGWARVSNSPARSSRWSRRSRARAGRVGRLKETTFPRERVFNLAGAPGVSDGGVLWCGAVAGQRDAIGFAEKVLELLDEGRSTDRATRRTPAFHAGTRPVGRVCR